MGNLLAFGTEIVNGFLGSDTVIGSMQIFAGSTVPAGYLLCDGREVSRTKYSELFEAIGTTWGAGDGSTTFNLPDMREVAPIGVGISTRIEDVHDAFNLGEFKDDQVQTHTHSYSKASQVASFRAADDQVSDLRSVPTYENSNTGNPSGRQGTVTRGKGIGVNYIIKAKQIIIPIDIRDELDEIESDIDELNTDLSKFMKGDGVVLYSNGSHINGTVNLSDDINNYKLLVVASTNSSQNQIQNCAIIPVNMFKNGFTCRTADSASSVIATYSSDTTITIGGSGTMAPIIVGIK